MPLLLRAHWRATITSEGTLVAEFCINSEGKVIPGI
jgi:hypothetical protein